MIHLGPPPVVIPPTPGIIQPAPEELLRYGRRGGGFDPALLPCSPSVLSKRRSAPAPTLTLTFFNTQEAQTETITPPTGAGSTANRDVAFLFDDAINNGGASTYPTDVIPSGFSGLFTHTANLAGFYHRIRCSYGVLADGSALTGMTGTANIRKMMLVVRADMDIATVTPSTWVDEFTSGNPDPQGIASASGAAPLIAIAVAFCSNNQGSFSSVDPAFDDEVTDSVSRTTLGYAVMNSSPTDVSVDQGDNGNLNSLSSGYLQVA